MSTIVENIKMGFGLGIGSHLASMIFIFVGLLFFIPGMIMVMRETKKPKDQRNNTKKIIGFVLMAIGMVFGMGMGLFVFSGLLGIDMFGGASEL